MRTCRCSSPRTTIGRTSSRCCTRRCCSTCWTSCYVMLCEEGDDRLEHLNANVKRAQRLHRALTAAHVSDGTRTGGLAGRRRAGHRAHRSSSRTCPGRGRRGAAHRRSLAERVADDGGAAGRCAGGPRRRLDAAMPPRQAAPRGARSWCSSCCSAPGAAFAAVFAPLQLSLLPRDPELIEALRAAIGTPAAADTAATGFARDSSPSFPAMRSPPPRRARCCRWWCSRCCSASR